MPKISTIAEVLEQDEDTDVLGVRGTIKSIFDHKSGDNNKGHWSFQSLVLADSTGEIKVKFKNRDALSKIDKGKVIEITCSKSDQHGWTGAKAKDDTYKKNGKDVTERMILVTPSADLAFPEGGGESAPAKQPTKQQAPASEAAPASAHRPATPGAIPQARHFLMQWAVSYTLAFEAALWASTQIKERTGVQLSVTDIKDMATSGSIAFAKELNIQAMPAKPLPPKGSTKALKEEPKPEPPPPPEPKPDPKKTAFDNDDASDDDIPF